METVSLASNDEEFAYGMLIKALTGGLYPNKFHIIREYVQNACDAIKEWTESHKDEKCRLDVKIDGSSIFIFDNATGMTHEKVGQYRYLGFSKNRYGDYVGYRGIGSAAGIAVAEELIVTTSPHGSPERYILKIKAGEMLRRVDEERRRGEVSSIKELMQQYTEVITDTEEKGDHDTIVELRGIKDEAKELLDPKKLLIYLASDTPVGSVNLSGVTS